MNLVLRIQSKAGSFQLKTLSMSSTVGHLRQLIQDQTGILSDRQKMLCGFPPKELRYYDDNCCLKDTGIKSGENIIIEELDEPYHRHYSEREKRNETERYQGFKGSSSGQKFLDSDDVVFVREEKRASTEDFSTRRQNVGMHSTGQLMRKIVPADNSCLFRSISILVAWTSSIFELRQLVAGIIISDPVKYNSAFLGRENSQYVDWILKEESWGGAIELLVFSEQFCTELDVVDVQSQRIDRFGEGKGYKERAFLLYDGIHYDPLTLCGPNEEVLQTRFPIQESNVLEEAMQLARDAFQARQYTDLANFSLCCLVCGKPLRGQTDAQSHAIATGHINFGEV